MKISLSLGSVCKIWKYLLSMGLRSGSVLLKVTVKGIFDHSLFGFLFKISLLGIAIGLLMYFMVSVLS